MKLFIVFVLAALVVSGEVSQAARPSAGKLSEAQVQAFAGLLKTYGGTLTLARLMLPEDAYREIERVTQEAGAKPTDKLPLLEFRGTRVSLAGQKRLFDFSEIADGKLSDGEQTVQFVLKSRTAVENFRALVDFMSPSKNRRAGNFIFLPRAYADETSTKKAYSLWAAAVFISSSAGFSGIGALEAATAGEFVGFLGAAAVLAVGAESLAKAGLRYYRGSAIKCVNGQLLLEDAAGKAVVAEWSPLSEIGVAELQFRKLACSTPPIFNFVKNILTKPIPAAFSKETGEGKR